MKFYNFSFKKKKNLGFSASHLGYLGTDVIGI